jgi:hypothetical protein
VSNVERYPLSYEGFNSGDESLDNNRGYATNLDLGDDGKMKRSGSKVETPIFKP